MSVFNIRSGVFETNSSSMHALSVFKKNKSELKNVPEKVEIVLSDYEFGWQDDMFNDFDSKLAYIWLCAGYDNDENKCAERRNEIKALLYAVGVKEIDIEERHEKQSEWDYGYVDHGDEAIEFVDDLLKKPALFYGWLFDSNSTISCGNDNDEIGCISVPGADYYYIKDN